MQLGRQYEGGEANRSRERIRERYDRLRGRMVGWYVASTVSFIGVISVAYQDVLANHSNGVEKAIGLGALLCSAATGGLGLLTQQQVDIFQRNHSDDLIRTAQGFQMPGEVDILLDYFDKTEQEAPRDSFEDH